MKKRQAILLRILWRNRIESIGLFFAISVCLIAIFGPWLTPFSPIELNLSNQFIRPNTIHWFGTDAAGRDVLSRIIAGTRISLKIAFWVVLTAIVIGIAVGTVAGLNGGTIDEVLMRIVDIFLSFPPLILAIAIAAAIGASLEAAIIGLAVTWWPGYARLVRAQVLVVKNKGYVESARAIGCSKMLIVFRHILLNVIDPLIVQVTLDVGYVILTAAGLGFIGVGAQPPIPEWGLMISSGRQYILSRWWISTFPGIVLFLTVLSFNLFGDMLRSELDPQLHQNTSK